MRDKKKAFVGEVARSDKSNAGKDDHIDEYASRQYDLGKELPTDDDLAKEWNERVSAREGSATTNISNIPNVAGANGQFDDPEAAAMGGFDRQGGNDTSPRFPDDINPSQNRPYDRPPVFNPESSAFFNRLSQAGKNIASRIFEGVHKMPLVNRIIGRLEITYSQMWINRHQKKSAQLKDKMSSFDLSIQNLNQSKIEIESTMAELHRQGMPGGESLRLQVSRIEQTIRETLNKKDKIQSKLEERNNKTKLYANSRDAIANKLINHYDDKLQPMENELSNLNIRRDRLEALSTGMEVRHREREEVIAGDEEIKNKLAASFARSGMSTWSIKRDETIRFYEDKIKQCRLCMQREKELMNRRKDEINRKIAKMDKKSNPYRDKREKFVRITENRPLDITGEPRNLGVAFEGSENTGSYEREWQDANVENSEYLEIGRLVTDWNAYLENNQTNEGMIDGRDFLSATGLSYNSTLSFKEFRKSLEAYYKLNRNMNDRLRENVDRYFAD